MIRDGLTLLKEAICAVIVTCSLAAFIIAFGLIVGTI